MAIIQEHDDSTRKSWVMWSLALMKRGLKPEGEIEVHGPHAEPADRMWSKAWCRDTSGLGCEVEFVTSRCTSYGIISGLRVRDKSTGEEYLVTPKSKLPPSWQKSMTSLTREKIRLQRETLLNNPS